MLKSIYLKNISPYKEHQKVEFKPGTSFLLGNDEVGKTNIFYAVRKCLSTDCFIAPNILGENSIIICEFDLSDSKGKETSKVYSCLFSDKGLRSIFRLILQMSADKGTYQRHCVTESILENGIHSCTSLYIKQQHRSKITQCFGKNTEMFGGILPLLKEHSEQFQDTRGDFVCKELLQKLKESAFVQFADKGDAKMPLDETVSIVDKSEEREIFGILTGFYGPNFDKETCETDFENQGSIRQYWMARTISFLIASRGIRTVCIDQPERGMHPQILRRLSDFIVPKVAYRGKVVILITHSPLLLSSSSWTNTFLFKQSYHEDHRIIDCSQLLRESEILSRMPLTEHYLTKLFFTEKVLFVEGAHDRIFVKSLIDKIFEGDAEVLRVMKICGKQGFAEGQDDIKSLRRFVINLDVVQMDGATHVKRLNRTCRFLDIQHYFLLSKDAVFESDLKENLGLDINAKDQSWENIRTILQNNGTFVWTDGSLEDSIRELILRASSEDSSDGIPHKKAKSSEFDTKDTLSTVIYSRTDSKGSKESSIVNELTKENIVIPIFRKGKIKARHKLFANRRLTEDNIRNSMDIFLRCCSSLDDDLVQFIEFLRRFA